MTICKTFSLPWAGVFLLTVAAGYYFYAVKQQDRLLIALEEEKLQLNGLRAEFTLLKKSDMSTNELAHLREENCALLGMRKALARRRQTSALTENSESAGHPEVKVLLAEQQQLTEQIQKLSDLLHRADCIQNLERIYQAKQKWAAKNGMPQDAVVTLNDLAEFSDGSAPVCPDGGIYSPNRFGTRITAPPMCSVHGAAVPE